MTSASSGRVTGLPAATTTGSRRVTRRARRSTTSSTRAEDGSETSARTSWSTLAVSSGARRPSAACSSGRQDVVLGRPGAGPVGAGDGAQRQPDELAPLQRYAGELAPALDVGVGAVGAGPDQQLVVDAPDQAVAVPVVQPVHGQRGRGPLGERDQALRRLAGPARTSRPQPRSRRPAG